VKQRTSARERISPGLTASLFANYRSSLEAVMELIDNFVDSAIAGSQLRIDVSVHPSSITITGVGGAGMGPDDFRRHYLNWGASPRHGHLKLGQYGQGGKAAVGFLGTRFSIEASRPGEEFAWRISDPDYRKRDRLKTYEIERVTRRFAETGYVRVRVDGVDKRLDVRRLQSRLGDAYRPLIERGELSIRLPGQELQPLALEADTRHEFRVRAAGTWSAGPSGLPALPPAARGSAPARARGGRRTRLS
jgi:hypothetical protein